MADHDRIGPPLRGGIVGFGFIAERGHLPAYALAGPQRFEIVAVADTCAARRQKARAAFPAARLYESDGALLKGERGRLDFVDVCTPPVEHARIARAALTAGFHVLCEKPLATRSDDAHAMIADARVMRRVLFPCHTYKHAPVLKTVQRLLRGDRIGRVHLVTLQTFRTTHAKGVDEWRRDWRRESRFAGGGIAMDHGSHTFYLAFDWLRQFPSTVTAKMSNLDGFDTEDNFTCAVTFPNGAATAHLSWTAGVRKVIYTIHGERGAIRVEDDDVQLALASGVREGSALPYETVTEKVASEWMDSSHVGWFRSLFEEFAEAISRRDFVSAETQASARCVDLITAAYASAFDGCRERAVGSETTWST
jgi:predicted dehydrogenase